ncbi:MAG: glycosyltransferase [Opitutales bacterium]|nr:glycosyltransferase [Opitutales bacterium]NRA26812.1 glycosyltransferase family 2 protein [Opitutales bacterium]
MAHPLVDILLPFKNAETTLATALDSLLGQTMEQWNACLIDDASSDDSPLIAEAYTRRDNRFRLIKSQGRGIGAALNTGYSTVQAPFIARMDADDWCYPERLKLQLDCLFSRPDLGVLSSRVEHGGSETRQGGYSYHVDWVNGLQSHQDMFAHRFVDAPLAHPSVMMRREILTDSHPYSESQEPEDYELWLRLFGQGVRFAKLPQVLLRWNDPPQRASRISHAYSRTAFEAVRCRYLEPLLKPIIDSGRELVFWSAGRVARSHAAQLALRGILPSYWVDLDPKKLSKQSIDVRPYVCLADASPRPFIVTWVRNRGVREKIREWLEVHGYETGTDYLLAV